MDLNPGELDELLGAWAFDALEPAERDEVDRLLADDPIAARRARELQSAVAALDENLATAPPADLGTRLLSAAARRPPRLADPSPPVELLARQVEALAVLLDELSEDDWCRPVDPYAWNVHGVVAHLLVIERYTASVLGLGGDEPEAEEHHLRMGADMIAAELAGPPALTVRAWLERARVTVAALRAGDGPPLATGVVFHGWPFSVEGVLIVRAFETWTHADDLRRAVGRPLSTPTPGDLRTMSTFSVQSLPLVLPVVAADARLDTGRIVLTGEGGGTFDLGRAPVGGAGRQLTIVADVVDYCRLVARRVGPDELDVTVEGDQELARSLLAAACAFAV